MTFLAILIIAVCVAFSQQRAAMQMVYTVDPQNRQHQPIAHRLVPPQRSLNLGGKVSGQYDLDEPLKFQILGWPLSVNSNGQAQAQAETSLHLGPYGAALNRALNLGGKVAGQYDLDEPLKFEILGWPLSVNSNGQAQAQAETSLHLGPYAAALNRALNLGGKVAGQYDLDEPLKFEILGWPLSVNSNGQAQAEAETSLHLGPYAAALNRALNLGGKVSGQYDLDEPLKFQILGWPLSVNSNGQAQAQAETSLHLGPYGAALNRALNLGGKVAGQYDLDEPLKFEILGWPLLVESNGQAEAESSVHLAHYANLLKRGLNLGGQASGKYSLDDLNFNILGWPLTIDSIGSAGADSTVNVGFY